jgi:uncharacterized protein
MAQPIIVAGATTESCAAVGPVRNHGSRSYSRSAGAVKWRLAVVTTCNGREGGRYAPPPDPLTITMLQQPSPSLAKSTAPVDATDRLVALDILRGLALFGVMAINVVYEFRVSIFEQFLPVYPPLSPLNKAIATFLEATISLKAFALFSLLFGVGLAIQFDRLAQKPRALLLVRRLLALLAFGLLHATLIWNGDILIEYALAGLVVLPLLYGPRWLLAAAALALLMFYSTFYLARFAPLPDVPWMTSHVVEARRVYGSGSFADILRFRIDEIPAIVPLHVLVFPRTLGLFLVGALAWRTGFVQRPFEKRGLLFGVVLATAALTPWVSWSTATVTLALGYGAVILSVASTATGARLLGWAAPLGRMAFTNYLAQSLIFGWTFYGYGLGLFGKLDVATALAFGITVYVIQVFASRWWLERYWFGPVEWLWRALMYGRRPPMRRPAAA